MSGAYILNGKEKLPVMLLEFNSKTQELNFTADKQALETLIDNDITWLLVAAQMLAKQSQQMVQEYLIVKKKMMEELESKIQIPKVQ